jgi:hypothetical protein
MGSNAPPVRLRADGSEHRLEVPGSTERVRATVSIEGDAVVNRMPKKDLVVRRFLCKKESGEPAPEGVKRHMCTELTCRGVMVTRIFERQQADPLASPLESQ